MAKPVRISLANKCQILFGLAVVVILAAALSVPWLRMQTLVAEGQEETARKLAEAWLAGKIELGAELTGSAGGEEGAEGEASSGQSLSLRLIGRDEFELSATREPFVNRAVELFETRDDRQELFEPARGPDGRWVYHYARAIRKSGLSRISQGDVTSFESGLETSALADPLEMILLLDLRTDLVGSQLQRNRIYILLAGLLAGLLAIVAFWFITTRLILSPVRVLRDTAEKVSEGDLNIRSEIGTGDEFQQLAETFNSMLESLKKNEDQLRGVNKSLDLKLGELAQSNVALYEANRIKSEFLANVSHELRTPLHSVIGFAEVLAESFEEAGAPADDKRRRYATNIALSSRRLLDLINDLLDLAKIEAGKIDLHPAAVSISDTLEGLINLLKPQAEKRKLEMRLKVDR
ncbi:MAG: HAMP domain-containing protein, partial [Phycisphaeraceae bacterium]|nr:HAMP domain-containing protein [Phycisphaeraceae bacterium]